MPIRKSTNLYAQINIKDWLPSSLSSKKNSRPSTSKIPALLIAILVFYSEELINQTPSWFRKLGSTGKVSLALL